MHSNSNWSLELGEECHKLNPEVFPFPEAAYRHNLSVGDYALCAFKFKGKHATEALWCRVVEKTETGYMGEIANIPVAFYLKKGDKIKFGPEHVCAIRPGQE